MKDKKPKTKSKCTVVEQSQTTITIEVKRKVDKRILKDAVSNGLSNPRMSVWSPVVRCMNDYYKRTIPNISNSKDMAVLIEKEFKNRDPDLYSAVFAMIEDGR